MQDNPEMFTNIEIFILTFLISFALLSFSWELIKRFKIILKGSGNFPFDNLPKRLYRVFNEFILQKKVLKQRFIPGLMHAFVFWGFVAFSLITIDHFFRGYGIEIAGKYTHNIRYWYGLILGIPWSILVIIGIGSLAYRRFVKRPKFLGEKISYTSGLVAIFIITLMVTYIIDASWTIQEHNTNFAFKPNDYLFKTVWWIHASLILGFLILIPRSKHLHLVLSPINIFFKALNYPNHEPVPIDMEGSEEELEELLNGLGKLSKKQALDIFSCVECGRCTEVCPANRGGGKLDPKNHFILDLKAPMLENSDVNLLSNIDVEAGWECTSCQACTEACPVGNEVEKSDEIRNIQVLVEGNVPQEYQKLFMNLQNTGNTEGATSSPISEKLPIFDGSQEYVLWLGCFGKYGLDPKYTESIENLTKILVKANVTYGILGKEKCTGEPANKLGDKLTYNMLMNENIENLKEVKKIVTMCPHCSVNLGIEYSKYHEISYEVFHHTEIIEKLIEDKKITVKQANSEKVTFHDPCNLSRGMNVVNAPRTAIKSACSDFSELKESGKNTLCCGAGGGLWWKKETQGRAHLVRAEQVIESGSDTVVTGCSFCYGMMNQGLGPLTPEGQKQIAVKDVADIVAENLE
tara:strand:+ start:603 stop:2504 length:1902 start_codon:yes stop_codon:yes gene_type:complete